MNDMYYHASPIAGLIRLEEYYQDALESTYSGVSGHIYSVDNIIDHGYELNIPDAVTSSVAVSISGTRIKRRSG